MHRLLLILFAALLTAAACKHTTPQPAASQSEQHSSATLILENGQQPAQIGIHFAIDKDWHIYWQNPGDSGEPPHVTWHSPDVIQIGHLQWPTPKRLNNPAGTDYGYETDVVLLAPITTTNNALSLKDIQADLRWLVCHDVCIPQKAQLRVAIGSPDSNVHQLITDASQRLPQPLPPGTRTRAVASPDAIQLTISTTKPVTNAEFFPLEPEQIDNAAQQKFANDRTTAHLTLKKSDHLQHDPERLKGVLVLTGKDQSDQNSYNIDVPVERSTARERNKS